MPVVSIRAFCYPYMFYLNIPFSLSNMFLHPSTFDLLKRVSGLCDTRRVTVTHMKL